MKAISLVTGANGLLGNTLVRELIVQGADVRASVRDTINAEPFIGLNCELVYGEILDKPSLIRAMAGADTLYHTAAVFKHWSDDPDKEIIQANLTGTRNVLEAAAESGIQKIVYVSSMAALDRSKVPMNESTWGAEFPNHYYKAKNDSEKLAWKIAEKLGLWMVTVLPSGIIGTTTYGHLSATNALLNLIVKNRLPVDPNFSFNFVHAKDVAQGMIDVAKNGRNGERYILATEPSISTTQVIDIARSILPDVKKPGIAPKQVLLNMATQMEEESKRTHTPPLLLTGNVEHFYEADERMDISKAKNELGYNPMQPETAIREVLLHLSKENF